MIFLFTDYGSSDIYAGQVKGVLAGEAPGVPVIDLLHEAPAFNVKAAAHLLAALAGQIPKDSVTLAVVDPGVGGGREAVVVRADGCYFVGPDNGLLSVAAARAEKRTVWTITWRPRRLARSFHGRDLFAPIAAAIASGAFPGKRLERKPRLKVSFGAEDLAEVIYVDHYGNAMTGLRASALPRDRRLVVEGRWIARARVFSEVPQGEMFWYENSLGLAEIAANGASAAVRLGLRVGQPVAVEPG
ncbi:MAG: SAM-dependent chlorinase/fluorinase [Betaproteobacteria bacterium]|nr:SAM-dependent chlorinase/fluorinase [Betaproteobacteria bacterium]